MKTLFVSVIVVMGLASAASAHHTTQHSLGPCGQTDCLSKYGR
jgi:hypothetical protein